MIIAHYIGMRVRPKIVWLVCGLALAMTNQSELALANSYAYGNAPPGCDPDILSILQAAAKTSSSDIFTNDNGSAGTGTVAGLGTGSTIYSDSAQAAIAHGVYGNGQCAILTETLAPGVGNTSTWVAGSSVQGNGDLQVGTAVATFLGPNGSYNTSDLQQHTGIYEGQDAGGMYLLEQYQGQAPQVRYIPWTGKSSSSTAINQGQSYYVIGH